MVHLISTLAFGRFPVMIFQINSMDDWERNRVEGYGILEVPHTPGFHELTIRTFKPNDDLYTKVLH
jgi:Meckel syndrome type 1 protein